MTSYKNISAYFCQRSLTFIEQERRLRQTDDDAHFSKLSIKRVTITTIRKNRDCVFSSLFANKLSF